MAFQTQIYNNLALGVEGEYADDSPRRDTGFILLANESDAVAAEGALTFTANPDANDTVTIANVVYTFKSTLAAAGDVKIGANLAATLTSLAKVVNGTATAGTDCYTGTKSLEDYLEAEASSTVLTLTAKEAGAQGNVIGLASSDANAAVTPFAGGVDGVAQNPRFACAFTQSNQGDGYVQLGGEGAFKGVLVNPKMYANYQNLNPSLELPSGSQGSVCDFGHVFVAPQTSFAPDYVAAFDKTTGRISAYVNDGAIPASSTKISNAKFIQYSGAAGEVGILQLGD